MKHVQSCLSAMDARESTFHNCRGTVRLVQACSCARKNSSRRFNLLGGAWEQLQSCLVPEKIEKAVSTAVEAL